MTTFGERFATAWARATGEDPAITRMRNNVTLLVTAPLGGLIIAIGSLVGWSQGDFLLSVMGFLFAGCFFALAAFRLRYNRRTKASVSSSASNPTPTRPD